MNSSADTPRSEASGVPRLVVVLLWAIGAVLVLVSLTWDVAPDDFAEEWSDAALPEAELGTEPDPLGSEGLFPVEDVDPDAELPGPEAITIDEFGYRVSEDEPNLPSWGATYTNTHPDYFAAFTIELALISEAGTETTMSYPIGLTVHTIVAPGESAAYGGRPFVDFGLEDRVDPDADITMTIVDPVWYTFDAAAVGDADRAPSVHAVTFETTAAELDSAENYLYVTVEAHNELDTVFRNGVVAVLYDSEGNIVGGVQGYDIKRVRELPPGESVRTFVLWQDDLPADADAAQTRFISCDTNPISC